MSKIIIKKPKAILLELTGTLVTHEFMAYSKQRKSIFKKNIFKYFNEYYPKNKQLRLDVNFFKMQEINELNMKKFDENCPKINDLSHKLPTIEVAIKHILWRLDNDFSSPALTLFLLHFNEWCYKKNIFVTPVYDEIKTVLENWCNLNIAIYIDVASKNFINMILGSTNQGNLIRYFSGHVNLYKFDGQKSIRNFQILSNILQLEPKDILFITRFPQDAIDAKELGVITFLLIREDFHANYKHLIEKASKDTNEFDFAIENKNSNINEGNLDSEKDNLIRYKSGLFRLTSKLNEMSQESGKPLSEDLTNKIVSMYDSIEDISLFNKENISSTNEPKMDTNLRNQSTICMNDLIQLKYIFSLSDISFI